MQPARPYGKSEKNTRQLSIWCSFAKSRTILFVDFTHFVDSMNAYFS